MDTIENDDATFPMKNTKSLMGCSKSGETDNDKKALMVRFDRWHTGLIIV